MNESSFTEGFEGKQGIGISFKKSKICYCGSRNWITFAELSPEKIEVDEQNRLTEFIEDIEKERERTTRF